MYGAGTILGAEACWTFFVHVVQVCSVIVLTVEEVQEVEHSAAPVGHAPQTCLAAFLRPKNRASADPKNIIVATTASDLMSLSNL